MVNYWFQLHKFFCSSSVHFCLLNNNLSLPLPPSPSHTHTGILLYVLDSTSGGNLNLSAWTRAKIEAAKEKEEEAKKQEAAKAKDILNSGTRAPYVSNITPPSAFHIRNRYLSRMGAKVRVCMYVVVSGTV